MNQRTILQFALAAVLILQAFAWSPPEKTAYAERENAPAEQLVYVEVAEDNREPLRFSF
jgi:hypothetical protein